MPYKYIEFKDIFLKASREKFIIYKYKYLLTITKIGKIAVNYCRGRRRKFF